MASGSCKKPSLGLFFRRDVCVEPKAESRLAAPFAAAAKEPDREAAVLDRVEVLWLLTLRKNSLEETDDLRRRAPLVDLDALTEEDVVNMTLEVRRVVP